MKEFRTCSRESNVDQSIISPLRGPIGIEVNWEEDPVDFFRSIITLGVINKSVTTLRRKNNFCEIACKHDYLESLKYFLSIGVPFTGGAALLAAQYGSIKCVRYICENGPLSGYAYETYSMMCGALIGDRLEVFKYLYNNIEACPMCKNYSCSDRDKCVHCGTPGMKKHVICGWQYISSAPSIIMYLVDIGYTFDNSELTCLEYAMHTDSYTIKRHERCYAYLKNLLSIN